MLIRGLGALPFSDVPADSSIYAATAWLKSQGISNGCGDGKFCPDDNVTRGQMALFLYRMAGGASTLTGGSGGGTGGTDNVSGSSIGSFLKDNKLLIGGAVALVVLLSMGGKR